MKSRCAPQLARYGGDEKDKEEQEVGTTKKCLPNTSNDI